MGKKPLVHILTTGGTIAMRSDQPMVSGNELIGLMPDLNRVRIQIEEFSRINSSRMTPAFQLKLLKRVQDVLARNEVSGVVITHGTDTMTESAFLCHLTIKSDKPIVFTGSMKMTDEQKPDGPVNIMSAIRTVAHPDASGNGAMIVMNGKIFSARYAIKVHNHNVDAFASQRKLNLGIVQAEAVKFINTSKKPHTMSTAFDVRGIQYLPKVDIVQDFTDMDQSIIEFYLKRDIDGLVVQTFAGGRVSTELQKWIDGIDEKSSFPIVIASGVPLGEIIGNPHKKKNLILSRSLRGNKARILLMLSLLNSKNSSVIQDYFDQY